MVSNEFWAVSELVLGYSG